MGSEQRDEFERRLLARVRRFFDYLDEQYPDGYEFGDFVVTGRYWTSPTPEQELKPWYGGPYPGWDVNGFTLGSSPSWWIDRELLLESLDFVQRMQDDQSGASEDDDADDERES